MGTEPNRLGTVIASKYRLDQELGRGGMGAVYRAFHLRVHKVFALKVLLGEMAKHRSIASRFLLEAQAAGRIGHPGILDVYDVGEEPDGTPYIVMELLRGEALSTLVRRERLDVDAACWIAMEVLDILEAAHGAGIIHRDVKPQNVFVTEQRPLPNGEARHLPNGEARHLPNGEARHLPDGEARHLPDGEARHLPDGEARHLPNGEARHLPNGEDPAGASARGVKLLDFGIAKFSGVASDGSALTRSGEIIGSPLYMAPEQAKGEPDLDPRADVWSVGAMLFEMLTGACAHAATTPVAVLAKILTEQAPAPSTKDQRIPAELDAVVAKALRIDRAERWPSAAVMRDALAAVRRTLGTDGKAPVLPRPEKISLPPASTDRTPGAITSTIIASDPPPSPSHRPSGPASRMPSHTPEAVAATERQAQAHAQVTTFPSGKQRSPLLYVAIGAAAVGAIAVGAGALRTPAAPPPASSERATYDEVPQPPASVRAAAPQPTSDTAAAASGTATASSVASANSANAAASSSPSASAGARAPVPAAPKCAVGEVVSNGHCCARGLEWQNGRCERPIATTF